MDRDILIVLNDILGTAVKRTDHIRGGDIGKAFLVETTEDRYFCKIYEQDKGYEMAAAEQTGLDYIRRTNTINTPRVLACSSYLNKGILVLEYIEAGKPSKKAIELLGQQLAGMHRVSQPDFGLESANFIGSLPQDNRQEKNWAQFYVNRRLVPQLQLALEKELLLPGDVPTVSRLESAIYPYMDNVQPSLLHGDLWSGNYMISTDGQPFLVDPAVYRGHAEVDLAMSRLFGAFPAEFYSAYEAMRPVEPGIDIRQDWYQLYYLLMHLNVFGSSYRSSVMQILQRRI
ncbi:fructosamine kinase family protein [Zeaxanthinibacter sp. PT1]|uniref:fructosamine kinase family protein n=1 Tax=Zeaxanthinibacter TaxID=561554 RepID=UPI00234A071B|nr:fructosamine kinase family protein [Zeaxanthinibacter sp. PT1]MDC6350659.1 fructosamine kinase family protein [Zeaxanthinibacter sp. PT1]